jgi:hypothetical protein
MSTLNKFSPALLTTAYLPGIYYFALLSFYDEVFIEAKETYAKQTFRNRCEILSGNGVLRLTIPVVLPEGNRTKIENVIVSPSVPWRIKHWRAIESAYNKSPYFLYYRDEIEEILLDKALNKLLELNHALLKVLLQQLDLNVKLTFTTQFEKKPETTDDQRNITRKQFDTGKETLFRPYPQVFSDRFGFKPNLCILDLLFNMGPSAAGYLTGIVPHPGE